MRSCPSDARCSTAIRLPARSSTTTEPLHPARPPVHEHERDALLGEVAEVAVLERRVGDDEPVDPAVPDEPLVDLVRDARAVGRKRVGLDDQHEPAGLGRGLLDAVGDLGEADVVEARDDQPDRAGPARAQAASERVRSIAQLARGVEDPLAGLGPHLLRRVAAQHAGRRRRIDLRASSDVRELRDARFPPGGASARRCRLPGERRAADDTRAGGAARCRPRSGRARRPGPRDCPARGRRRGGARVPGVAVSRGIGGLDARPARASGRRRS